MTGQIPVGTSAIPDEDGGLLLAIDTSTRTAVVALGTRAGRLVAEERWSSQHRHGVELLQHLDALFTAAGTTLDGVGAVVAGLGPGSFTGLRVGLATAKVIAYSRRIPIVAVSSFAALAHGALAGPDAAANAGGDEPPARVAVTLPAGSTDRYLAEVKRGKDGLPALAKQPRLVAGSVRGPMPALAATATTENEPLLIAVDLDAGQAAPEALGAGHAAVERLAEGLVVIGAARLRAGDVADIAELVPAYVALPRGVTDAASGMAWSPDLR